MGSFSEPFIRRPIATSLIMIFIMIIGIAAYRLLPVASFPTIDLPTIRVFASLPGASPETMASSVAMPLERQLGQIAGVTELTSQNQLGSTSITVQFSIERDTDGAARDVEAAINAATSSLPADLPNPPIYRKSNPVMAPVLVLAVTSETLPPGALFDYADSVIAQKLSQVEGVAEVLVNGAEKSAVRIQADAHALASMGLSLGDVREAIRSANVTAPVGSLNGETRSWTIDADSELFGAAAYRNLIIAARDGRPVRLEDVATAIDGVSNTRLAGWYGDRRAVVVLILRQPRANLIETTDRVRAALPTIRGWLPQSIDVDVLSDRSGSIRSSIEHVQGSLLLAIALVIMSIFLFLRRLWATVIPSVAIPVALLGTFAVMYAAGLSLNNLSLMALTIATGFVVDDAIVMIENIARLQDQGKSPMQAAIEGARQIGFTIISISLSLIAVFVPVVFMGGMIGKFFQTFGITLSAAVAISALVSLTLTPMMCARLLRPEHEQGRQPRWGIMLEAGFNRLQAGYARSLDQVMRFRRLTLLITVATAGLTIWLYGVVPKGFVPVQDAVVVNGFLRAPPDISFEALTARTREAASIIMADPAIASMSTFIGGSGPMSNRMMINLKPRDERGVDADRVIDRLRKPLSKVPGMGVFLQPSSDFSMGTRPSPGRYQYALLAETLGELDQATPLVLSALRALPILKDVTSDQENAALEIGVTIDRDAATRLGISIQAIDDALYDAFGQRRISTMYTQLNTYQVILEIDPRQQRDPVVLETLRVPGGDGRMIPLAAVAQFTTGRSPLTVSHQGQSPAVTVFFTPAKGVALSQATDAVEKAVAELNLGGTVRGQFSGEAGEFRQSGSNQLLFLLAAIVFVYIVLGILYESTIHPLTILSTIPSAGLGALLALLVAGVDFSMIAMIGIILLVGIVKKNAILMVDFALEQERSHGRSPADAIREACLVRFRPIMMTTLAAVLGALPLALDGGPGSELRRVLGITVLGGLLLSQTLTLYTTPVVYLALDRLRPNRSRRLAPLSPAPAE